MTATDGPDRRAPADLPPIAGAALFALCVLFGMNLLNYVDRYVFAAVGPGIIRDLDISKQQFGLLTSAFIVVYTLASPAFGILGDRGDRRKLMAFGVALWSVATVGTAFARSFHEMGIARAFLGIGEASYGVVAPTLLADFFDTRRRGKIMGVFYLAMPVGTAIGYAVGGLMEKLGTTHAEALHALGGPAVGPSLVGWRLAFWVVGVPGLVLAVMGLLIRDPGRGASDPAGAVPAAKPTWRDYLDVLRTPSYLLNTAGMAAITFTTGAFGAWFPSYFEYVHGTKPEDKVMLGIALAVGRAARRADRHVGPRPAAPAHAAGVHDLGRRRRVRRGAVRRRRACSRRTRSWRSGCSRWRASRCRRASGRATP